MSSATANKIPFSPVDPVRGARWRAESPLQLVAGNESHVVIRNWLTIQEYAAVVGISYSALRKHLNKAFMSPDGLPFPRGHQNPLNRWFQPIEEILIFDGVHGRRFNVDALDLTLYPPDQVNEMRTILQTIPATKTLRTPCTKSTRARILPPASISTAVLALLSTDPGCVWTRSEILDHLADGDALASSTAPANALDAALLRLWRSRRIEHLGIGLYRHACPSPAGVSQPSVCSI
jgi:hypothetical protein